MSDNPVGLTANVAGQSYDLNDGQEIRLLDYDLGLAAIRRLSQRAPAQLGDTDLGFRVDPRYVNLFWAIKGADLGDYRDIRAVILEVFQPRDDDAVQLIFDFGDRVRAVDVSLEGELAWTERVRAAEKVSGVFKASDPRLYHPDIQTVSFGLEAAIGGGAGWPIPWAIPWAVGSDHLNMIVDILYAGGSRLGAVEYPVFRLMGPLTDPIITNETTQEGIDLTDNGGVDLADNTEWIDINLSSPPRRDSKFIRDQDGNSADQYLTTASDLATFHLAPAGERLPDGSYSDGHNRIRVEADNVDATTLIIMTYYNRFQGV